MLEQEKPYIFISHAAVDEKIANALSELIEEAFSGAIGTWFSSDKKAEGGCKPGSNWFNTIHSKLKNASQVFTIVTPQSISHPWIFWESGIGAINCPNGMMPIAIGIEIGSIKRPLGDFDLFLETRPELLEVAAVGFDDGLGLGGDGFDQIAEVPSGNGGGVGVGLGSRIWILAAGGAGFGVGVRVWGIRFVGEYGLEEIHGGILGEAERERVRESFTRKMGAEI